MTEENVPVASIIPSGETFILSAAPVSKRWELSVRCGILVGLISLFGSSISGRVFHPVLDALKTVGPMAFLIRPSMIWATMGSVLLIFRTALWFCYRPAAPATADEAPRLTVIIPAFNE